MSSVFRRSYPAAPVSPLRLFGRMQCLAYQQEVEGNAAQRHHVRFWRCPDGWLLPLLSIIGKHAEHDMAGAHPESWRGRIEAAGIECRPVLKGTVEYEGFTKIWAAHLEKAIASLPG